MREEEQQVPILRVIYEGTRGESKYSAVEKLSACMGYACTGQIKQASDLTGIPYEAIRSWKRSAEWWDEAVAWCRREKQDELDGLFTEIIDLSMSEIKERLQKGDKFLNEDGQECRKPISIKELAVISGIAFDKRQLVRGDPNRIVDNRKSTEELVDNLILGFTKLSRTLTDQSKPRIIEGETINATEEVRKTSS
jgi:hypothetical protein